MTLYILANPNAGSYTANSIVSSIKDNYPQFIIIDSILEGKRQSIYVLQSSFGTVVNSMDIGFAAQVINSSTDSALKRILNKIKLGKLTYLFFSIKTLFPKQSINI